jgi:SAM-dependent methyltransferase
MPDKSHTAAPSAQTEVQPLSEPWIPPRGASDADLIQVLVEKVRDLMNWRQMMDRGVSAFQIAASEHLQALTANIEAIIAANTDQQERIGEFERAASQHLERLSQQTQQVQAQVALFDNALYAVPYMADPALLRTTDAHGRAIIGFSAGAPDSADVYLGFEDIFRGPEAFIRERQRVYVPLVIGHDPVLDIGCGRGEFLDLLASAHIPATGVDSDAGMVARCQGKGLHVVHADALQYLRDAQPQSVGTVFAAQVVEHFSYDSLLEFFRLVRRALRPGGLLIAETVNPHALPAFKTFWTDLTHHNPIFPEVAVTLCHLAGYQTAAVLFPNGVNDLEQDRRTQGEYAVVATTPGPHDEQINPLLVRTPERRAQQSST